MNARSAEVVAPTFEVAERMILAPSGLDERRLSTVLGAIMTRGVDYADLYFQLSREESWALEDGIVKEGSHNIEQGVGVRAISGEKVGFAYTVWANGSVAEIRRGHRNRCLLRNR